MKCNMYNQWSLKKKIGVLVLVVFLVFFGFLSMKVEKTFSFINNNFWRRITHINNYQEKNRIDILVMGLRGKDDIENGGLLTDTIMLISINTDTDQAAFLSIPRDLYVKIPKSDRMEKINFAYAYGKEKYKDGLSVSRLAVEQVTGINIDYAAAIDFSAFNDLIDSLGGVDVYVPKDFIETSQWGWEFHIPKGMNHMDSKTALYYVRSRFSTSDFDRSRRQQDVLMAIGNKIISLKILSNPVKLNSILNSLSKGVDTDIDFISMLNLMKYAKLLQSDKIVKFILNDSPDNLLVADHINGAFVLYPKAGMENYDAIKEKFKNIFQ